MSALTDKKIMELINNGQLKIEGFDKNRVTSNGYDMLLEDFEIQPGEFKLVNSKERIEMPNNLIAIPFLRTTYAFKGLFLSPGVIDTGFKGPLKFALYNSSQKKIEIEKTEELKAPIHVLFMTTDGKSEIPFGGRIGEINN